MGGEITAKVEPNHLRIGFAGEYSYDAMIAFIDRVKELAVKNGRSQVLMDCRNLTGQMTEADRFRGGQYFARVFGPRIKAALLMPPGQVTKLGQLAAVNRGADLLVTESEDEAVTWLLGDQGLG